MLHERRAMAAISLPTTRNIDNGLRRCQRSNETALKIAHIQHPILIWTWPHVVGFAVQRALNLARFDLLLLRSAKRTYFANIEPADAAHRAETRFDLLLLLVEVRHPRFGMCRIFERSEITVGSEHVVMMCCAILVGPKCTAQQGKELNHLTGRNESDRTRRR